MHIDLDYDPYGGHRTVTFRIDRLSFRAIVTERDLEMYGIRGAIERAWEEQARDALRTQLDQEVGRFAYEASQRMPPQAHPARMYGRPIWDPHRADRFVHEMAHRYDVAHVMREDPVTAREIQLRTPELDMDKEFEWAEGFAKEIKTIQCKAKLLDTYGKVKNEGETMRHCLWTDHKKDIAEGSTVAYPIDTPKSISEIGITMTFDWCSINELWEFDQHKGFRNCEPRHHYINNIRNKILSTLNKVSNKQKALA